MSLKRPWKSLDTGDNVPVIFLKAYADKDKIVIQLTDLNRIWGINLSRRDLIESARDQGTSIDPGEDDEQFEQFAKKVGSAFEGDKKTTCDVQPDPSADALRLTVSAPLPAPLPTFRWSVGLKGLDCDSAVAFESNLLTPLLVYTHSLRSQIDQLIEEIGHKDRVISKITDKLETSGNDLTQVFPGVSNIRIHRKSSQRSQLASHINGLAEFDQHEWRLQAAKGVQKGDPSIDDIDDLFQGLPDARLLSAHKDVDGVWWEAEESSSGDRRTKARDKPSTNFRPALDRAPSSVDDKEFQRQTTPSQLKQSFAHEHDSVETEDDDEDDLDAPSQRTSQQKAHSQHTSLSSRTLFQGKGSPQSQEKPSAQPSKPKIGTFKGRQAKSPAADSGTATDSENESEPHAEAPHSTDSETPNNVAHTSIEQEVPTESDGETSASPSEPSPPKSVKKAKIGMFSGRKRYTATPDPRDQNAVDSTGEPRMAPSEQHVAQTSPPAAKSKRLGAFGRPKQKAATDQEGPVEEGKPASTPPKHAHKLGNFSGRKSKSPPAERPTEERQGRASEKPEEVEQERENSEERANKQRDRLKRELEEKSKVPVKKKRKF